MNGKKAKLLRAVAGYKKAVEPPSEYPTTISWSPERGVHPVQLTAKYEKKMSKNTLFLSFGNTKIKTIMNLL